MKLHSAAVDTLQSFKFLDNDEVVDNLKLKLPAYLAAPDNVAMTVDPLVWWEQHTDVLTHGAMACKKVPLCQPSSAAVERVCSLLNSHFDLTQNAALENYIEAAVMMQYN